MNKFAEPIKATSYAFISWSSFAAGWTAVKPMVEIIAFIMSLTAGVLAILTWRQTLKLRRLEIQTAEHKYCDLCGGTADPELCPYPKDHRPSTCRQRTIAVGLLPILLVGVLTGCGTLVPKPQRGGTSELTMPGVAHKIRMADNSAEPSTTTYEKTTETTTVVPPGLALPGETNAVGQTVQTVVAKTTERHTTTLGSSRPDSAREAWGAVAAIEAKIKGSRWMQIVGVFLLLAAAAMFHPAAFLALGGSRTTQWAIAGAGIGLIALPMVVVGNEALLGVAALALLAGVAVYFFAIRHGQKEGELRALKAQI